MLKSAIEAGSRWLTEYQLCCKVYLHDRTLEATNMGEVSLSTKYPNRLKSLE